MWQKQKYTQDTLSIHYSLICATIFLQSIHSLTYSSTTFSCTKSGRFSCYLCYTLKYFFEVCLHLSLDVHTTSRYSLSFLQPQNSLLKSVLPFPSTYTFLHYYDLRVLLHVLVFYKEGHFHCLNPFTHCPCFTPICQ